MRIAAAPDSPIGRRVATLIAGIVLVAAGVALTIRAELGVAPYDVLTTGIADLTGLPIGVAAVVLPVVFTALGLAVGGKPGIGTLIAIVGVGPVLGLVLAAVPDVDTLAARIPVFVVGFLLVATGITLVVVAELGPGPAELLMLGIHDRGFPLAPVRTAIEVASVGVGWLLGGQVGVGTAVVALTIGPILRRLLIVAGFRADRSEEAATKAAPGA